MNRLKAELQTLRAHSRMFGKAVARKTAPPNEHRKITFSRLAHQEASPYLSLAKASLIALKLGSSLGVGVCSL